MYFVVMPLAGVTRKESLSLFPRELFFDKLVAESRASGGIHYMDYGDLRTLVPPDGTHLDQSDMTRFTKSFVGILNEKLKIK